MEEKYALGKRDEETGFTSRVTDKKKNTIFFASKAEAIEYATTIGLKNYVVVNLTGYRRG